MAQFVSLIREIMPAWLSRRSSPHAADKHADGPSPQDADTLWHGMVEKDMFGANTADYTHVDEIDDDHPVGQAKPAGNQ